MSAWVSTHTPFTDRKCLEAALEELGVVYSVSGNDLVTDRRDYYGDETFVYVDGTYIFQHDSAAKDNRYGPVYPWNRNNLNVWMDVGTFLGKVEESYLKHYESMMKTLAEEERKAEIRRKQEIVNSKKEEIIRRAKDKGYAVKESKVNGQVQLVLVRTVY